MPTFHPALRPHLDAWLRLVESRLNDVDRVIQEELGFRQAPPEMIAIRTQLGRLLDEIKTGGPGAVVTLTTDGTGRTQLELPGSLTTGEYHLRLFSAKNASQRLGSPSLTFAIQGQGSPPTVTPTATRTATATATPTGPVTTTQAARVDVAVARTAPGQLAVTITARDSGCTPNGQLRELRFGNAVNARIDVPGQAAGQRGSFTLPLAASPRQVTFTIHQDAGGQAVTVPLTVVDGCGEWPTFVGGRAQAF